MRDAGRRLDCRQQGEGDAAGEDRLVGAQVQHARPQLAAQPRQGPAGAVGLQGMRPTVTVIAGILAPILTEVAGSSIVGRSDRI